jgi:hypothetical protein
LANTLSFLRSSVSFLITASTLEEDILSLEGLENLETGSFLLIGLTPP